MSELLDKVKGTEEDLDTTMAFKMNLEKKTKYIEFIVKHKLSSGKVCREAFDTIMKELVTELEPESLSYYFPEDDQFITDYSKL